MRIHSWITLIGYALLLGGCSGDNTPPGLGTGGGALADSFTNAVAQNVESQDEDQEPSEELAQMADTEPEDTEPVNL